MDMREVFTDLEIAVLRKALELFATLVVDCQTDDPQATPVGTLAEGAIARRLAGEIG